MNDQTTMRVRHSLTYAQKQHQPLANPKVRYVRVDRNSLDVLHRQIGPAILHMPRVDHMHNRRMIHRGEELALFEKALAPAGASAIRAQQLDGHRLLDLSVMPFGKVDCAHAPLPEQPDEAIGTALPDLCGFDRLFGDGRNTLRYVPNAPGIKAQQ
jgi:hypothetical protein